MQRVYEFEILWTYCRFPVHVNLFVLEVLPIYGCPVIRPLTKATVAQAAPGISMRYYRGTSSLYLRSPGGSATPTRRRENRPLLERLSRITSAASSYEIVNSGTFCLKANAKASLGRT